MAKYYGSALISEIWGQLGQSIFYRYKNQTLVKMAPVSILDPHTAKQDSIRSSLSVCSSAWRGLLTDSERALWESFANKWPQVYSLPSGIRTIITDYSKPKDGQQAFLSLNQVCYSFTTTVLTTPPINLQKLNTPINLSAVWDGGTNSIDLTWDLMPDSSGDIFERIWIRSQQESFHKQIGQTAIDNTVAATISQVSGALGAIIAINSLSGETVYIQCDRINPTTGQRSGPSNCLEFLIP